MTTELLWKQAPLLIEGEEIPKLHYYPAAERKHPGCVVIFPGGGFSHRAVHEGDGYARFLNENGMDAFVVDYRIIPYQYPCELLDARRAVRVVRSRAKELGLDPDKIAVMGSSAGGTLVGLLCTVDTVFPSEGKDDIDALSCMPDAQILCYPYICMDSVKTRSDGCNRNLLGESRLGWAASLSPEMHVKDNPPPAFFFHTFADNGINVSHSFAYAQAIREKNGAAELHIYPEGRHGLGLCEAEPRLEPYAAQWGEQLIRWLSHIGF